jgi:hypothetical protein
MIPSWPHTHWKFVSYPGNAIPFKDHNENKNRKCATLNLHMNETRLIKMSTFSQNAPPPQSENIKILAPWALGQEFQHFD